MLRGRRIVPHRSWYRKGRQSAVSRRSISMIVDDIGILKPPQARCLPHVGLPLACFLAGLSRRYSRPPQALRYSEASSGSPLACFDAGLKEIER